MKKLCITFALAFLCGCAGISSNPAPENGEIRARITKISGNSYTLESGGKEFDVKSSNLGYQIGDEVIVTSRNGQITSMRKAGQMRKKLPNSAPEVENISF